MLERLLERTKIVAGIEVESLAEPPVQALPGVIRQIAECGFADEVMSHSHGSPHLHNEAAAAELGKRGLAITDLWRR